MDKGIGCIYKHSQRNWPYLSPNTTLVVSPLYDNTTLQGTPVVKSTSPDNQILTKPLACLHKTRKVDSTVNLDDESHYFSTPREKQSKCHKPSC